MILDHYKIEQKGNALLVRLVLPNSCSSQLFDRVVATIRAGFPYATVAIVEPRAANLLSRFVREMRVTTTQTITASMDSLLSRMCKHLTILDSLDESHALAPYQLYVGPEVNGEKTAEKTYVGELVYSAKYQGSRDSCDRVGDLLVEFVKAYPSYGRAPVLCAVPPSDPSKSFHLATHLAQYLAGRLGKNLVRANKLRQTQAQKDLEDEAEKRFNVQGSMAVKGPLQGRSVILLDDLYESGSSMEELARACRTAGAGPVLGLAATKNRKGLQVLDVEGYAERWIAN